MMYVDCVNAQKSFAGPGMLSFDAEARVIDRETEKELYVHVSYYDCFKSFTVDDYCIDDNWENNVLEKGHIEEYDKLAGTKESKFAGVFRMLNNLLSGMGKDFE